MKNWRFVKYTRNGDIGSVDFEPFKWLGILLLSMAALCFGIIGIGAAGVLTWSQVVICCGCVVVVAMIAFAAMIAIAILWIVLKHIFSPCGWGLFAIAGK